MPDAADIVVIFLVPGGPEWRDRVSGRYSKKSGDTMGHNDGLLADHRLHKGSLGNFHHHPTY